MISEAGADGPAGRWPNFFLVGASRSGTTSMWEYLRRHPEVYMAALKEPHFFSGARPRHIPYVEDELEYLQLFSGATGEKIIGEASPSYLRSEEATERIKTVSPDARILIMLREPVARAYSHYWHRVRYGLEDRDFLTVVRDGLDDPTMPMLRVGRYPAHVRRYLDTFSPNVLVLVFEEFAGHVRDQVRRVLEFLDVDQDFAERFDATPRNITALPRNKLSRGLYVSWRLRSFGRSIVPSALHGRVERFLLPASEVPRMDLEARRLLENLYRPEVEELEGILGRTLPWRTSPTGAQNPAPSALDAAVW